MPDRKHFHILFLILIAIVFVLAVRSSPAQANLTGSNVTFAPSIEYETGKTSASCYVPGKSSQILCFNFDTTSPDGQDATALAIQFPTDWEVYGRWIDGHYDYTSIEHNCTNGGTMNSALSWSLFARAGQYWAGDNRVQNNGTSCHALYCFFVRDETDPGEPPYDDELDATVSWSWGGGAGTAPTSVCSSDGLYPRDGFPCEAVSTELPATVPVCEFTEITILPETLPHAVVGQQYTQQLSPTNPDPNYPVYHYTLSGSMPSDFYLFSNTGGIWWIAPQIGTYTFTVNVTGPGWSGGTREYTIVVDPELIFEPNTLPPARQNVAYNQPITVTGGTAPYTLSLQSGTLPAGISLTDGAFTGTPTETGTFTNIVILAVDANGVSQTHTYSLTVYKEHLFTWTPANPLSGQTMTATGEPGFDWYTWRYGYNPDGGCDSVLWGNEQEKTFRLYGMGNHKVCLTVTSYSPVYMELYDEQWITVLNGPPIIDYYWNSPNPSIPGQPVEAGLYFYDYDALQEFTCEIDWGDGTTDTVPGILDYGDGWCEFPPHIYDTVGVYEIDFSVTDSEGAKAQATNEQEVVWLFAEPGNAWLASNILPTTVKLYGYAPAGTETLQFAITSDPEHGSLSTPSFMSCESDSYSPQQVYCWASAVFTPQVTSPLYVGSDSFEFTVSDDDGHTSEPAAVDLWLDENDPPTAEDGTAIVSIVEPSYLLIFGTDMDSNGDLLDEITFHIDSQPQHGTLQLEGYAEIEEFFYEDENWSLIGAMWFQALTYTPNPGTTATTDTFTFHVNDNHQDSAPGTITLTLHAPTTLHVNVNDDLTDINGCDETHCSLREAVADALVGDTIDFTLSLPNTITLTEDGGGELLIDKNIRIAGPGGDRLSISAGFMDPEMDPDDGFRVIHIFDNYHPVDVEISGLTIRDGRAWLGGGVYADENTSLIMSDCVIGPNNIVSYAGGGLVVYEAEAALTNCSIVDNHGTGTLGGAGIFVAYGTLDVTNSTISGNITNNYGGGLYGYVGKISLTHTTISGNIANQNYETEPWGGGGGIYLYLSNVTLQNSIVAGNIDLTEPSEHAKWPDVNGSMTSLGRNLIGDGTGSTGWLPGDMVGTAVAPIDPILGVLDVHEPGTTPTYPLLEGSPAIDSAACLAAVTTDQRGVKRPQGFACDIGSFEVENPLTYLFLPLILR